MSALKSVQRPIRNHVGASVAKAGTNATTEDSVVGKKAETSNKAIPARGAPASAPRVPTTSATQSEPPMDVDPRELIPPSPPAGAAPANPTPVAIDDMDLEDDSETLMFKRPEPPGPPRRPPPPKAKPAAPPAKPGGKPPLPAPTRAGKPFLAIPKAGERPAMPPAKPVAKPPPPKKAAEKPMFPAPAAAEALSAEPKMSDRPLFEVTIGSEKPLLATPEAGEISLLAPRAPNMPLLATPQASDLASLDLKVGAPLPALPMLDFSRDVGKLNRSSPPGGLGARIGRLARPHAKWLVMTGGTLLIAAASWTVFHAAAAGSDTVAAGSARGAMAGAHTLAAGQAARPAATAQPVTTAATQPVAAANPEPVAPPADPPTVQKNGLAEAVAAAHDTTAPSAEQKSGSSAEVAARPGAGSVPAAPKSVEAPAPAERSERTAPVAAVDPPPRPSATRSTASSRSSDTELPAGKAAPEPAAAPAPAAPVAPPSVGGFDGTADFDQSAAMGALRQAAESARRCATTDAPSGGVRIAVTFARSGGVSATQVEGPAAGTPLGDCVVAKFQTVHVPPFRGSVMTVRKTVMF